MKASIDNLRSAGIATIISAGNGASRTQIGQPACISSAIAVAASSKTDVIASYTDISTQVAVFAPGGDFTSSTSQILSSVPAGFNAGTFGFSCNYPGPVPSTGGSYCYLSGTSMAAPTVAGAWAAIRTVCPNSTVDQILNALVSTGTPSIADSRSGGTVTKNRIRVDLAVQQLACATPPPPPITSPAPGSTLTSNSVMFTGGHTGSDLEHWLYVGTTLGGNNLFNQDLASGHAATVGGLPSTGTIFVRYWTRFGSGWQFTDQQYTMNVSGVPPSLSVNPTTVSAGGSVTATWSGIASPSATDWIGLYAPGTADTAYLAWIYVSCSKTAGSAVAAGSCAFPIPGRWRAAPTSSGCWPTIASPDSPPATL